MPFTNVNIEVFTPGEELSGVCTAAVRGSRFVVPSADIPGGPIGTENIRIAEAGAGAHAIGVARYDGVLNEVIPFISQNGACILMPAGVSLTFGQAVQSDAQGRPIVLAAGAKLGVCLSTQATVDGLVLVRLSL